MHAGTMDVRIDHYVQRLKGVGHHYGHDPRRHDHQNLRQEEEEEDEDEDEDDNDEEEQGRGRERQDHERREQVRPAVAERRPGQAARNFLSRHERDPVAFDEEEGDGIQEEVVIQEPQRVKRHHVRPDAHRQRDFRGTQTKRARVSEASTNEGQVSGIEAGRGEASPAREEGTDEEESEEIEGSDLFGDRTYEEASRFDFDHDQEYGFVPYNMLVQ